VNWCIVGLNNHAIATDPFYGYPRAPRRVPQSPPKDRVPGWAVFRESHLPCKQRICQSRSLWGSDVFQVYGLSHRALLFALTHFPRELYGVSHGLEVEWYHQEIVHESRCNNMVQVNFSVAAQRISKGFLCVLINQP